MKKITLLLSFVACVVLAQSQTTIFSESFDKVTTTASADANGNIASSTDISSKLDSVIGVAGWTGAKIYVSDGKLKLGTSSAMGSIVTPVINLLATDFTVTLDIRSWTNTGGGVDTGSSIDILLDDVVKATVSYTATLNSYTTPIITGGTTTSKIKFAAKVAKNRFFIDNIKVASIVTGVSTPTTNLFIAIVSGKNLQIKNVANGSTVEIFNALGAKVQTSELVNSSVGINNLSKGLYIVRVGKSAQKIML